MSTLTVEAICDAIAAELGTVAGVKRTQSFDQLTEGMATYQTLQVYPEEGEGVPMQATFRGGVKVSGITIYADLYGRQRSSIGEDMAVLVPLLDGIIGALQAQPSSSPFGLEGARDLEYSWRRVIFEYGSASFIGIRFTIRLRVY